MTPPIRQPWPLIRKVFEFVVGSSLFWLTLVSVLTSSEGLPWFIYGDFSWRTFIHFFNNMLVVLCLSPVAFLTGIRLFGLATPQPLLYAVFAIPVSVIAAVVLLLSGLGEVGSFWGIVAAVVISGLFGAVYLIWPTKPTPYRRGHNLFWFIAFFFVWALFALPWQSWLFALLPPTQQRLLEDAAFGPSLEASKSFVRDCQPFINRYGRLTSLELSSGFAHYDAEKNIVDVENYTLFFEAEKGQDSIVIDVPPGSLGFYDGEEFFCGKK